MKFIAKKHYTFAELATRWECGLNDLVQAVIGGELIPSVHIASGKYARKLFTVNYDEEGCPTGLQTASLFDGDDLATVGRVGFHYLIWPRRTEVADCEFCIFSENPTVHNEGDICFELTSPVGISYVLEHGVVMQQEVARVEATSDDKSALHATEKPIAPRERDTLLTIIGVMLELIQSPKAGRNSAAAVIKEMIDNYGDKPGIKVRTLQEKFALAKKVLAD